MVLLVIALIAGRRITSPPLQDIPSISSHTLEAAMNELKFTGEWNELKGKLKQKYAQLTEDDLLYAKGKEDELLGRLQKKLGQGQDEIRKVIASL
jgi:uncharacterized protein YjbJ (UPF0337 family)